MSAEMRRFSVAFGIIGYLATLGLVAIAAYALWAGPQRFGVAEPWPLVAYFVVSYVGTVLVAYGTIAAVPACGGLLRRGRASSG